MATYYRKFCLKKFFYKYIIIWADLKIDKLN